jgi:hypothetical protein
VEAVDVAQPERRWTSFRKVFVLEPSIREKIRLGPLLRLIPGRLGDEPTTFNNSVGLTAEGKKRRPQCNAAKKQAAECPQETISPAEVAVGTASRLLEHDGHPQSRAIDRCKVCRCIEPLDISAVADVCSQVCADRRTYVSKWSMGDEKAT